MSLAYCLCQQHSKSTQNPYLHSTDVPDNKLSQNPGGSFLCQPHPQPDTNVCQNACLLRPPCVPLPKTRSLQSYAGQYATRRHENAPIPASSAHLPTPVVTPNTALLSASSAPDISRAPP